MEQIKIYGEDHNEFSEQSMVVESSNYVDCISLVINGVSIDVKKNKLIKAIEFID